MKVICWFASSENRVGRGVIDPFRLQPYIRYCRLRAESSFNLPSQLMAYAYSTTDSLKNIYYVFSGRTDTMIGGLQAKKEVASETNVFCFWCTHQKVLETVGEGHFTNFFPFKVL